MGLNFFDFHDFQKNHGGYRIIKHTVHTFQIVHFRFDVMNSRTKYSQNKLSCALGGVNTVDQLEALDNMHEFLNKFRVLHSTTGKVRNAKLPWEHGMLCSIKATKALYEELVVNGPFEFLMTAKLNQDCLENLFSRIRGKLL